MWCLKSGIAPVSTCISPTEVGYSQPLASPDEINALPTSERASDGQPACDGRPPSSSRRQHERRSVLQLVCRGQHWRPSVRLPTRAGLYASILFKVNTETVAEEGRLGGELCKGVVSAPFHHLTIDRAQDE
jgi:hypothetical protein